MAKQTSTSPFQAMEEEAYQAFLEWPIWLALREKELANYLAADQSQTHPRTTQTARADNEPQEENQNV